MQTTMVTAAGVKLDFHKGYVEVGARQTSLEVGEAIRTYCLTSKDVAATVRCMELARGVGKKAIRQALELAGWEPGFLPAGLVVTSFPEQPEPLESQEPESFKVLGSTYIYVGGMWMYEINPEGFYTSEAPLDVEEILNGKSHAWRVVFQSRLNRLPAYREDKARMAPRKWVD